MNYPKGTKKTINNNINKSVNYKNRGMNLEKMINDTNLYYIEMKKAYIYKKPTPIKLVKVDYKKKKIEEAYFEKPSTTDYNGIYKGKYIDFEAKETKSVTSFNLNNIHKHQIIHLKKIVEHGGIGFLIIRFTVLNKTYLIEVNKILEYIDNHNRKSIPLDYIENFGYIIVDKYNPIVDYLEIVDKLILKENKYVEE